MTRVPVMVTEEINPSLQVFSLLHGFAVVQAITWLAGSPTYLRLCSDFEACLVAT